MLERAEKQAEIFRVVFFFLTAAVQEKAVERFVRFRLLFFFSSFFSFSQAQSKTHMTERILVGGNEAVCTARRR